MPLHPRSGGTRQMPEYKCSICGGTTDKLKICCGKPVEEVFEVKPKGKLRERHKAEES